MGDNVMIYVDDIQHCNPEFLQKFISLCDAQRKIEGVYKGKTRTYDLRGKKVAVVMAGNPYTESGEKFQIPDMLANRADTYNLGDIIGDSARGVRDELPRKLPDLEPGAHQAGQPQPEGRLRRHPDGRDAARAARRRSTSRATTRPRSSTRWSP